jgi:enoyl-CoA hydratase
MTEGTGFKLERLPTDGGHVAIFTIHGRSRLNLVGADVLAQCTRGIRAASDSEVRCAVLQGASQSAFVGGADLLELQALEPHNAAGFVAAIHGLCSAIREFPVPVVARLQGHCLGGGLEIAAACDIRVADSSAFFGMPEVRVGVPSVVEAALLPMLIGWGKTRELVYRGNIVDAEEAARIGLIEQLTEPDHLDDKITEIVNDIVHAAPNAIRLQKDLCRQWEGLAPDAAIEAGLKTFAQAYESDEPARYCEKFFLKK